MLVGDMWSCGRAGSADSAVHVEEALYPLLPTFLVEAFDRAPHPDGPDLTRRLAELLDLHSPPHENYNRPITTDSVLAMADEAGMSIISAESYLRLRLLDVLVGDWSRNKDDIEWTVRDGGWRPHPRPYRNAFPLYEGLLPWVTVQASDAMGSWTSDPSEALDKSFRLEPLDRRILSTLPQAAWDSTVVTFRSDVLAALLKMRTAFESSCSAGRLVETIRNRAEGLPDFSRQYERVLTRFVEFHGTRQNDSLSVRVLARGALEVREHSPAGERSAARLFNSASTKEIRFLMKDGIDAISIEGVYTPAFSLIVDRQNGLTRITARRSQRLEWEETPPSYVGEFETPYRPGGDGVDDAWAPRTLLYPWVDVNPDDGLFVGAGPEVRHSAYLLSPYASRSTALVGMAARTGRFRFELSHRNLELVRGLDLGWALAYSQLNISNFFGLGNETAASEADLAAGRFKADQRHFNLLSDVYFTFGGRAFAGIEAEVRLVRTDPRPGSFIDSLVRFGYVRRLNYASVGLRAGYFTEGVASNSGPHLSVGTSIRFYPQALQNDAPFVRSEVSGKYGGPILSKRTKLIAGVGGVLISGAHPWFESAFLGGAGSLRGYERQRFGGNALVRCFAEVRQTLGLIHLLWPVETGTLALVETGRVFVQGERSRLWHSSVGFGFWLSPVRSEYSLECSLARSGEMTAVYAALVVPLGTSGVRSFFH